MRRTVSLVAFCAAVLLWASLIALAPVLASSDSSPASRIVASLAYVGGGVICHQRPDRSFHVNGAQLPVCARCAGLYWGAAAGALLWVSIAGVAGRPAARAQRVIARTPLRPLLMGAGAPTLLTVITASVGWWDPANAARAAIALPLGALAGALVAAVVARDVR